MPPLVTTRSMAKRIFIGAVLAIVALGALGLWVTEGDHGRETGAASAYLIAVGVSLLIVTLAGVAFTLSRRASAPAGVGVGLSDAENLGEGTGRQGPWANPNEGHRADKQQGDLHALDVEGDPRGGSQSQEYRLGGPTDLVVEGDTAMMGPGGAPQDDAGNAEGPRR